MKKNDLKKCCENVTHERLTDMEMNNIMQLITA